MGRVTTIAEAEDLLSEIKLRIREDGLAFMNQRAKNAQTLADLGIVAAQQREIIENLTAEDYYKGPDPDEKYSWKLVAVFGVDYEGVELYIKFSIGKTGTPVVCLSFHKAQSPMRYQFK
jgi:DNA-directed RNA polymerase subunit F